MRQRIINSSNIGKLTLLVGVLLLCPLATLPFYPDEADNAVFFLLPSAFSIVAGAALCLATAKKDFRPRQADRSGDMTVLFGWLYGFLAGAMPFFLSGRLSFVQSLFEAVSGWTTTGLSVMDVTTVPSIFLFHRSFMQFCGGLGFVMVMIVFMSGRQAMDLYSAEGHPDKIMPTLRETVRAIFLVYLASLAVGTAAYTACGMPVFDSILHTMGALSTGGFSNMVDSIGAYHSVAIEAVSIVLMIIGTTNFAVVLLFVRGRFRKAFRAGEVRFLGVLLVIFVPITALSLTAGLYMSFGEGLRQAIFNIVSALSTTGYSTMSYVGWPGLATGVMILMMLIGGGIGSTAGGIKLSRVIIMVKTAWSTIKSKVAPEHEVSALYYYRAQGKTQITDSLVKATAGFITCYLTIYIAGTLLLTVTSGAPLTSAMFEFASALGTVGLSVGITGPATNAATLIVEMAGMFLGRLEIYIVLTGIYSAVHCVFKAGRRIK